MFTDLRDSLRSFRPTPFQLRSSGAAALVLSIAVLSRLGLSPLGWLAFFPAALILAAAVLCKPESLRLLALALFAVVLVSAWFVSRVVLALIFYIILTPIGVLLRRFSTFFQFHDRSTASYWEAVEANNHPESMGL